MLYVVHRSWIFNNGRACMLTPPAPQLGAHVEHTCANCPHYCGSRQPTARPADPRVQRQSDGCAMQAWPRRLPRCCRPAAVAAALPGGSRQGLRCGSLAGPLGLPSLAVARLFRALPGQHSIARAAQGGRRSTCRSRQVEPGARGDAMRPCRRFQPREPNAGLAVEEGW